jgi:hypothetical protein
MRVSRRLRANRNHGRGEMLAVVPRPFLRPSPLALEWHGRERYLG